jgi:hypothetical protein
MVITETGRELAGKLELLTRKFPSEQREANKLQGWR